MQALLNLAKVRRKLGAHLGPLFLLTFSLSFISPVSAQNQAVANAELLMQFEQMQHELRELRNLVEIQAHQLEKLQEDERNRYIDLDERAQDHSKRITQLENAPRPTSLNSKTAATPAVTPTAPTKNTTISNADQQAYNLAYANIPEQRFDEAISAFQTFIKQHPESRLIGNAYYWLGEVYMAQNRTAEAEKMFQVVVRNHPESFKLADSKYKLGLIQMRYGKEDQAKKIMQEIIQQHPREPAADLARNFLKLKT